MGCPSSGPQADDWDNPNWKKFVKAYQDLFKPEDRFPSPGVDGHGLLQCDHRNGEAAWMRSTATCLMGTQPSAAACRRIVAGPTRRTARSALTSNRQAIGTNFLTEVVENADGTLSNKLIKVIENVNQTMGIDKEAFAKIGLPSRENPECKQEY